MRLSFGTGTLHHSCVCPFSFPLPEDLEKLVDALSIAIVVGVVETEARKSTAFVANPGLAIFADDRPLR